jgi:outer membrane protein TolC
MGMSALFLSATLVMTPAQDKVNPSKEQIEESVKKVKELQKERIDTLKELTEQITKLAQSGRVEFGEVLEARMLLLKAELDAAEKESDRIALYQKTIDTLKEYEERANAQVKAGRGTAAVGLKIKARRLEVEIQLEQAKVKHAKENK